MVGEGVTGGVTDTDSITAAWLTHVMGGGQKDPFMDTALPCGPLGVNANGMFVQYVLSVSAGLLAGSCAKRRCLPFAACIGLIATSF